MRLAIFLVCASLVSCESDGQPGAGPTGADAEMVKDEAEIDTWIAEKNLLSLKVFANKHKSSKQLPRVEKAIGDLYDEVVSGYEKRAAATKADPAVVAAMVELLRDARDNRGNLKLAISWTRPSELKHDTNSYQALQSFKHDPMPHSKLKDRLSKALNRDVRHAYDVYFGKAKGEPPRIVLTYAIKEVGPFSVFSRLAVDWSVEVRAKSKTATASGTVEMSQDSVEYKYTSKANQYQSAGGTFYRVTREVLWKGISGGVVRALGL